MNYLREWWKNSALPLTLLVILSLLFLFWKLFSLPTESEVIHIAKDYFEKYGLITVLISAALEGLLLVGLYYPGSVIIFLGVIFAGESIRDVIRVVAVVTLGLYAAYTINFFLGKYGWYRLFTSFGLQQPLEDSRTRLTKYGPKGILLTYWQPNLAALTSTAAGILQLPFRQFFFYSVLAGLVWNIFWGTLVYFAGEATLSFFNFQYVFLALGVWIITSLLIRKFKKYGTPEGRI